MVSIVYGHEVKTLDDKLLRAIVEGIDTVQLGGAQGAHIVDLLPICEFCATRRLRSIIHTYCT